MMMTSDFFATQDCERRLRLWVRLEPDNSGDSGCPTKVGPTEINQTALKSAPLALLRWFSEKLWTLGLKSYDPAARPTRITTRGLQCIQADERSWEWRRRRVRWRSSPPPCLHRHPASICHRRSIRECLASRC